MPDIRRLKDMWKPDMRVPDRRVLGQERCRTGGMQDRKVEGLEGLRTGEMQDRKYAGQEGRRTMGCRTGGTKNNGMQDRRDSVQGR